MGKCPECKKYAVVEWRDGSKFCCCADHVRFTSAGLSAKPAASMRGNLDMLLLLLLVVREVTEIVIEGKPR